MAVELRDHNHNHDPQLGHCYTMQTNGEFAANVFVSTENTYVLEWPGELHFESILNEVHAFLTAVVEHGDAYIEELTTRIRSDDLSPDSSEDLCIFHYRNPQDVVALQSYIRRHHKDIILARVDAYVEHINGQKDSVSLVVRECDAKANVGMREIALPDTMEISPTLWAYIENHHAITQRIAAVPSQEVNAAIEKVLQT